MKIISWNLDKSKNLSNEKEFLFVKSGRPTIILLQNVLPEQEHINENIKYLNYKTINNISKTSKSKNDGTQTFIKGNVKEYSFLKNIDVASEGRLIEIEINNILIINFISSIGQVNTPLEKNKIDFYRRFVDYIKERKKEGKSIIIAGDFRIAFDSKDLVNANTNKVCSGHLDEEVEIIQEFIDLGLVDPFRQFNPEVNNKFTFWPDRMNARRKNKGWRYDYFLVSSDIIDLVKSCEIMTKEMGSTHCPIILDIDIEI